MDNKKNLFIINSPLEFINAREAIYLFNLKNIIFLVIYNRSTNNITQLNEQLKDVNYGEIIQFYPSRRSSFFEYIKLIKQLKKYSYEKVFTGDLNDSNFRIIIANLVKEKLFLLDEGTSTIEEYEKKIKTNKLNRYKIKEFRYLLSGLRLKLNDDINFFTYYDFEPLFGGEVIRNKMKYIRKDFKRNHNDYSEIVFFLGQPEFIFADSIEINLIIKKIIQKYKDKKILYIPHREEKYKHSIKNIDKNIEILDLNKPIEKYFLDNGIYPKHVISYLSTALTTTKILFPECLVEYVKIKNPYNKSDINNFEIIYTYFEKDNILEFK
ncbi:hypothetical protein [Aliarcobacter vitoriensis]|uniref:Uncharacterized protein n=1 Tax=Aliarcobacter vitoriensis TaxID=2011099 RepID=A0A366MUW5_9BACT|nr:hypothetical protein [Aliarcobacter vitoriensis]RBQ29847.1 hypothetical protein CRU91_02675 [Aliarcobacter vitoriensis]